MISITESPREAFQANSDFVPSEQKVKYIKALMKVGFDIVEIGSIVSPKLVPQLADTMDVISKIDFSGSRSKPMVLLVNKKGADLISGVEEITHICYPFPVSGTFAKINLNSTVEKCFETVDYLCNISVKSGKTLIVYLSMAFGNPYGDEWSVDGLSKLVEEMNGRGVKIIPLSNVSMEIDTGTVGNVFSALISRFPGIDFGCHLHTQDDQWQDKLEAAWLAGCRRFDSVMHGMGGCPMTRKEPLANLATEKLVRFLESKEKLPAGFNMDAFIEAGNIASEIINNK